MDTDMGPLPQEHPREANLERARREMSDFLAKWNEFWGLSTAEGLLVLAEAVHLTVQCAVASERRKKA